MARDLEDLGAVVSASSSRENITYSVEVLRNNADEALALVAESILKPQLVSWQLDELKAELAEELAAIQTQPQAVLTEALLSAAYGDVSPIGRSQYPSSAALSSIGVSTVEEFMATNFTAPNMALACVGADAASFSQAAQSSFASVAAGPAAAPAADTYLGGETRLAADSAFTYVALALNTAGSSSKDAAAVRVLQALLAAKLEGSGASAFSTSFTGSALLGAYGAVPSADVSGLVGSITQALASSAAAPDGAAFAAAVARARAAAYASLDTRTGLAQETALALLSGLAAPDAAATTAAFAAVTAADVQRVAAQTLSTPVTIASLGDLTSVPRVGDIKF